MISLNDYLFSGNTVLKILHQYSNDLRNSAKESRNSIDLAHSNFLIQIIELLEHNDFLTSQSQRIKEFYKFMTREYPFLAFTFKGRIKSLIRAEEKFNGYILEFIYNYYKKNGAFPSEAEIKSKLNFRDLIAYRIVISMPVCHIKKGDDRSEVERKYLYEIANALPEFLEERGFTAEVSTGIPGCIFGFAASFGAGMLMIRRAQKLISKENNKIFAGCNVMLGMLALLMQMLAR